MKIRAIVTAVLLTENKASAEQQDKNNQKDQFEIFHAFSIIHRKQITAGVFNYGLNALASKGFSKIAKYL